ncbi:MAG: T9SS type A sorting domain-containing protein [Salibacteraceae bacterium]
MKNLYTLLLIVLPAMAWAQHQELPNNEFDNWDTFTRPTGWATFQTAFGFNIGRVERDAVDKQNGAYSLKVITPAQGGFITYSLVTLNNMSYNTTNHVIRTSGTAYQSRPDTLWMLYKYEVPNNQIDTGAFALTMQAVGPNNTPIQVMDVVVAMPITNGWTLRPYPLANYYSSTQNPDSIYFSLISSASQSVVEGATLFVDGIYFNNPSGTTTSVQQMNDQRFAVSVYPNPSLDKVISIKSANLNCANCTFRAYSTIGQVVANEQISFGSETAILNLDYLNSGSFFFTIINEKDEIVHKGKLVLH